MSIMSELIQFIQKNSAEKPACNLCGSKEREIISKSSKFEIPITNVICKDCGLIYVYPRLDEKSYSIFYQKYYRKLYSYFSRKKEIEREIILGKRIVEYFSRLMNLKGKRILDFGCGYGGVLSVFKNRGAEVFGLDYDEDCTKEKDYIQVGGVDKIKGKFDIIILSNIIEHLIDPLKDLKKIISHLEKDGYVYITLTGIFAVYPHYGYDLEDFLQIAHPYTFSLKTLTNLLKLAGLEVVEGNERIFVLAKKSETKAKVRWENDSDYKRIKNFIIKWRKVKLMRLRNIIWKLLYKIYYRFKFLKFLRKTGKRL